MENKKKKSKPQKCVPSQEGIVERKFPLGVHPSRMTKEEAHAYWLWYTGELYELEALPKDTDKNWED